MNLRYNMKNDHKMEFIVNRKNNGTLCHAIYYLANLTKVSLLTRFAIKFPFRRALILFSVFLTLLIFQSSFAMASNILHIGDSHTVGSYGQELHQLLSNAGNKVTTIGCSGASAISYINGGYDCIKEGMKFTLGSSTIQTSATLESFSNLIKNNQPEIIIISLGTNYLSSSSTQSQQLVNLIPPGITCYWVGPPHNKDVTPQQLDYAVTQIESQVSSKCKYINSLDLTDENLLSGTTHYTTGGGKMWANGVFKAINSAESVLSSSQTNLELNHFDTLLLLGNQDSSVTDLRVKEACKLLEQNPNFKKIILSGGKSDGDIGKSGKTEAEYMDSELRNICPVFYPGNLAFYKESLSGSTSANYKNSQELVYPSDKLLVLSNLDHVKSVAYCFKYKNQIDTAYYIVGKTPNPAVPNQNDICGQDYTNIITSCMGLSSNYCSSGGNIPPAITTSGTNYGTSSQQYQTITKEVPRTSIPGCGSTQRCKEIDEVWSQKIGQMVSGNNQVWDHNSNALTEFKKIYFETITEQVPISGGVTYTSGPSAVPFNTLSSEGGSNDYDPWIMEAGANSGIDPALIKAVISAESDFDPNAVTGNFVGLMQIKAGQEEHKSIDIQCNQKGEKKSCDISQPMIPGTYLYPVCSGSGGNCQPDDRYNPEKNIFFGAEHLKSKKNAIGLGSVTNLNDCQTLAIAAAYNMGEGVVGKAIKANGNQCDSWQNVWQKIYENTKCNGQLCTPTTKCPEAQGNVFEYGTKWDDVCGKIYRKNGIIDPGEPGDYIKKIYEHYLKYKSTGLSSSASGTAVSGMAVSISPISTNPAQKSPANPNSFSFVVLGDAYSGGNEQIRAQLVNGITQLSSKPDFVISTGDMTCISGCDSTESNQNYFSDSLQGIQNTVNFLNQNGIPFYPVAGNHDFSDKYSLIWGEYLTKLNVQKNGNDPYSYSFGYGNSKFIVFNDWKNYEDDKLWVNQQTENSFWSKMWGSAPEHYFAFAHVPLEAKEKDENVNMFSARCTSFGPALQKMDAFFAGHDHVFDYSLTTQLNCPNVKQVIVGVSGSRVDEHKNGGKSNHFFLVVNINGESVNIDKYDLSNGQIAKTNIPQNWYAQASTSMSNIQLS